LAPVSKKQNGGKIERLFWEEGRGIWKKYGQAGGIKKKGVRKNVRS